MELQNDNLQDFFIKMDEALAVNETLKTSLSLAVDALLKVCGETEKQLEIIRDWTSSEAGDVTLDNGVIIPNATKILEELRTKTQEVLDTIPPTLQGYKEEFEVKIDELIATKTQEIETLKNDLQNKVNENIAKHDEAITEDREAYETLKADLEARIQEIEAQAFLNEFKVFKESVNQTIASLSAEVAKLDDIDTDITSINETINQKDSQNVKLTGNQSIAGNKTFRGATTTAALTANGAITAKSTLAVTGNTTIAGTLTANGTTTFATPPISETNPRADNQVANKAYVDSVGDAKVALSGNQTIAGNKTFSGTTTLNGTTNTKALNASGKITAKSTLEVTGATTLNGNLTTNGAVDFKNLPTCATQASSDNQLVNLATLKTQVPLLGGGLGYGQTWKEKILKTCTNYTNNTKKPIALLFSTAFNTGANWIGAASSLSFLVDNVIIHVESGGSSISLRAFFIIPQGSTYKIALKAVINHTGGTINPVVSVSYLELS